MNDVVVRLQIEGQRLVDAGLDGTTLGFARLGDAAEESGSRASAALGAIGDGLGLVARHAQTGAVWLGGRFARAAQEAFDGLNRGEGIAAQTAARIASTGNAARASASHTRALADRIEALTSVESRSIQEGQNLLRTFTGVQNQAGRGNAIFDRATWALTNMNVALGQDSATSALQLGQALQDPVDGLAALERAGVSFSRQQRDQMTQWVRQGDTLRAQRLILRELRRDFGGAGRALGQTTGGRLDLLGHRFARVQERLLAPAIPLVDKAIERALPLAERLEARVDRVMSRRDLTLEQKAGAIWRGTSRDVQPLLGDVERWIEREQIGRRLARGVERAVPAIMDAAATSAVRSARAFVRAWWGAGVWARLLTAGFLMSKLRAWGPVGRLSARAFTAVWRRTVGRSPVFALTGREAGRRMAASTAASTAAQLPASFSARRSRWSSVGRTTGTTVGRAAARQAALGAATSLAAEGGASSLAGQLRKRRGGLGGAGRIAGRLLGVGLIAGVALMLPQLVTMIRDELVGAIPFLDRYSGSKGWGNLFGDVGKGAGFLWDKSRIGDAADKVFGGGEDEKPKSFRDGMSRSEDYYQPPNLLTDPQPLFPLARAGRATPAIATLPSGRGVRMNTDVSSNVVGAGRRDLHIHQHIDGREIARTTLRRIDSEEQWR